MARKINATIARLYAMFHSVAMLSICKKKDVEAFELFVYVVDSGASGVRD